MGRRNRAGVGGLGVSIVKQEHSQSTYLLHGLTPPVLLMSTMTKILKKILIYTLNLQICIYWQPIRSTSKSHVAADVNKLIERQVNICEDKRKIILKQIFDKNMLTSNVCCFMEMYSISIVLQFAPSLSLCCQWSLDFHFVYVELIFAKNI